VPVEYTIRNSGENGSIAENEFAVHREANAEILYHLYHFLQKVPLEIAEKCDTLQSVVCFHFHEKTRQNTAFRGDLD